MRKPHTIEPGICLQDGEMWEGSSRWAGIRCLVSLGQQHCYLMLPRPLAPSAARPSAPSPCTPRDDAARGHRRTVRHGTPSKQPRGISLTWISTHLLGSICPPLWLGEGRVGVGRLGLQCPSAQGGPWSRERWFLTLPIVFAGGVTTAPCPQVPDFCFSKV